MISIEEITDDNEVASQAMPGPGQEDKLRHPQHNRQDPTPAQQCTELTDAQQPVEKAQQGNSEEDIQACNHPNQAGFRLVSIAAFKRGDNGLQAVVAEAEQRKQDGNALFKQGNYADAVVRCFRVLLRLICLTYV